MKRQSEKSPDPSPKKIKLDSSPLDSSPKIIKLENDTRISKWYEFGPNYTLKNSCGGHWHNSDGSIKKSDDCVECDGAEGAEYSYYDYLDDRSLLLKSDDFRKTLEYKQRRETKYTLLMDAFSPLYWKTKEEYIRGFEPHHIEFIRKEKEKIFPL
jgi:hypothetical protein